ncbi:MAG: protein-L-isoaspartate(D-aspartate) O-methyltransferase [Candidatus Gygaella obscura]|nr:protein-L-isoaspartate(D-aspartate) O-methyltransferase [Candidatus Gygaella obscura]
MTDFENQRKQMVELQLAARNITSENLLTAFLKVKRELFVPEKLHLASYADNPLPIAEEQTISQPYIVALMIQLLDLKKDDCILEIGTGSGYETALLANLVDKVYTIELIAKLQHQAKQTLEDQGLTNIEYKIGDGSCGWGQGLKFDKIIVSAAATKVPELLITELNDAGIMVIPVGERFNQIITIIKKENNKVIIQRNYACSFVPLKGDYT